MQREVIWDGQCCLIPISWPGFQLAFSFQRWDLKITEELGGGGLYWWTFHLLVPFKAISVLSASCKCTVQVEITAPLGQGGQKLAQILCRCLTHLSLCAKLQLHLGLSESNLCSGSQQHICLQPQVATRTSKLLVSWKWKNNKETPQETGWSMCQEFIVVVQRTVCCALTVRSCSEAEVMQ